MNIEGSVALVTGANRGIGRRFVEQLLERGAAKVYAAARDPRSVATRGVEALAVDLLDQRTIDDAAARATDVTLLVNNAGISTYQNLIRGDQHRVRQEMETNFFGPLAVTRAFADTLGRNGGGGIINMLSALSFFSWDGAGAYGASKAAAWSLTNGTRVELAGQGTQVLGVYLGAADTDMMEGYEGPLLDPADVVRIALDGLAAEAAEVFADEWSSTAKAGVAKDPKQFYAEVAAMFAGADRRTG